jgi:hypothetical protein
MVIFLNIYFAFFVAAAVWFYMPRLLLFATVAAVVAGFSAWASVIVGGAEQFRDNGLVLAAIGVVVAVVLRFRLPTGFHR